MQSIRRVSLVIGVNVALSLALLEIVARVLDPLGISYFPETARFFDHFIHEDPIGYRLPPSFSGEFYGTRIRTNALGMRDRDVPPDKGDSEFRVAVLGDSVAFGLGVEFEDSIPFLLEKSLAARSGLGVRTLNFGVPSYNTEQSLIQLESLGPQLQPDLVILLVMANDIEAKRWVFDRRQSFAADIAQRSYALSLLFSVGRTILTPPRGEVRPKDPRWSRGHPRWQAIESALIAIADRCRMLDARFMVIVGGADGDAFVELPREVGAAHGFPVAALNLNRLSPWKDDPASFNVSATNGHCNARGCRVVADRILDLIDEAGVLETTASGPSVTSSARSGSEPTADR